LLNWKKRKPAVPSKTHKPRKTGKMLSLTFSSSGCQSRRYLSATPPAGPMFGA
jgi:hypothetical protein